ncbi:STAS domain-containing protein [Priestia megaterium]|uniref:STAS domain-containing protein n=1 Tax=Priestia megaterium TaxID=1404 RepID=UPI000BA61672|nr:RsbT co-antagonist protein RsbRB [Priestia megaterium]
MIAVAGMERGIVLNKNEALRMFFLRHADQLTEEWYESIEDNDPESVYASTHPEVISVLKDQNNEFHLYIADVFIKSEKEFFDSFETWILKIAEDGEHVRTPIHYIIREFFRVRKQYLTYLNQFVEEYEQDITQEELDEWNELIVRVFDITVYKFVEEHHQHAKRLLEAHKELINELSSPVIPLSDHIAILPLVGDIDTARASRILENTLTRCAEQQVNHLYIDISGVVIVDTMVAHQIFQLIDALKLIGVESTISGVRPEIAITASHLGLSFENISTKSTLANAMASRMRK